MQYNMSLILFTLGIVIGFLIFEIFSGRKQGKIGSFILILETRKHFYHLHHWFISLIILIILSAFSVKNNFIDGFLIGAIIQGLTYKDFYKFLIRKKEIKLSKKAFN